MLSFFRAALLPILLCILPEVSAVEIPPPPKPSHPFATSTSNLETLGDHIRQFAFDGHPSTFFASTRAPGPNDHFTLEFDPPIEVKRLEVLSGKPDGTEKLNQADLEIFTHARGWKVVGHFSDGIAKSAHAGEPIRAIRIKASSQHVHPLVIREIVITSTHRVPTFAYPVEYAIDVADIPEMRDWAITAARFCESWYPTINRALRSEGFKPPTQVLLALKRDYGGLAETSGNRITLSIKYFEEHPAEFGVLIHESAHVVQHYKHQHYAGWLVEGIADYVRFFIYEPGKAHKVDPDRVHFDQSYQTSATFLDFITKTYDKHLVLELNKLLRDGKYEDDAFRKLTGKSAQQLDAEWLESLRN